MAKTIRIPKSKNLLFKKLTFLYLVFILFLFLTSPGDYVEHYPPLASSQEELNEILEGRLQEYSGTDSSVLELQASTLSFLNQVDQLKNRYSDFAGDVALSGFRLKENRFAEDEIRHGDLSRFIDSLFQDYASASVPKKNKENYFQADVLQPSGFQSETYNDIEYYFHETPNAAIPSIFEHFKTVALYHALSEFPDHSDEANEKLLQLENLLELEFVEKFRSKYILGQNVEMEIFSTGDDEPRAFINGESMALKEVQTGKYQLEYHPPQIGSYSIKVQTGGKSYVSSFDVEKPRMEFVDADPDPLDLVVGQPKFFTLNTARLPRLDEIHIQSSAADVERVGNRLILTARKPGAFGVELLHGDRPVDKVEFFAREPQKLSVEILNASGKSDDISQAFSLKSSDPLWEVLEFDCTIVSGDGKTQSYKNSTRYLSGSARKACKNADEGSVIIFENVKLLSSNGSITETANPLVIHR